MIRRGKASVKSAIAHRTKKSKTDGTQAIRLGVTNNRKPKYYGLKYTVLEEACSYNVICCILGNYGPAGIDFKIFIRKGVDGSNWAAGGGGD